MKITEDFIGNETKELTKTKIASILRWWGFNPDSYSTWGNARVDMNNILSGSSSSTISDRERASSFLSKINYINDTDTVISDTLFAANEPGVWYDPSDLSTLFQDAAGTTPVTAVEQPVGLMLDKSKGLVLGPELVTNGDFSNGTTGWVAQQSTIQAQNGACLVSVTGVDGRVEKVINLDPNKRYLISADLNSLGVSSLIVLIRGVVGNYQHIGISQSVPIGQSRRVSFIANPTGGDCIVQVRQNSGVLSGQFSVDNISVRELPGNHASQPTSTSRPVLSARVNLLTKTEQFDDAAWTKLRSKITQNVAVAPNGASTADKLIEDTTANSSHLMYGGSAAFTRGVSYTMSLYAKAAERSFIQLTTGLNIGGASRWANFNLSNGTIGSFGADVTPSIIAVGNGWFRCQIVFTPSATATETLNVAVITSATAVRFEAHTGDGTSGIYIWGADLRVANDGVNLPPYQRVNTATDYDTVGFPHYLRFDGVDDGLVTNTITPGIDKVQVFAGVRKLSDAAIGALAELSPDLNVNSGIFALFAPSQTSPLWAYRFTGKGILISGAGNSQTPVAPTTDILTGLGDISGDRSTLRINGVQAAQNTADQGTGNYLAYPLYIGRRGGTTLPFNGRLYSLIVRFGANLPTATIQKTEKYINGLTKAY